MKSGITTFSPRCTLVWHKQSRGSEIIIVDAKHPEELNLVTETMILNILEKMLLDNHSHMLYSELNSEYLPIVIADIADEISRNSLNKSDEFKQVVLIPATCFYAVNYFIPLYKVIQELGGYAKRVVDIHTEAIHSEYSNFVKVRLEWIDEIT